MHDNDHTHYLRLLDGRTLSYTDVGTGERGTWIHCHGIPGSRHELAHLSAEMTQQGLRVIVPDRPGYGDSTDHPDYHFDQHARDVLQLADALNLQRFGLSGFSGGGVFALAAARVTGHRTSTLTIAGTPALPLMSNPFEHASTLTASTWQAALSAPEALAEELQTLTGSAMGLAHTLIEAAGTSDARLFNSGHALKAFTLSTETAVKHGPANAAATLVRDTRLVATPWPFDPAELDLPARIIHGQHDGLVHLEHFHALSRAVRGNSQGTVIAGTGHYGVLHWLWKNPA